MPETRPPAIGGQNRRKWLNVRSLGPNAKATSVVIKPANRRPNGSGEPPFNWKNVFAAAFGNGDFPAGTELVHGPTPDSALVIYVTDRDSQTRLTKLLQGLISWLENRDLIIATAWSDKQGGWLVTSNTTALARNTSRLKLAHRYSQQNTRSVGFLLFCPKNTNCDCAQQLADHIRTNWSYELR